MVLKHMHGYYCKVGESYKAFKFMDRKAKKRDDEFNITEDSNKDIVIRSSDYVGPDNIIGAVISSNLKDGDIISEILECDEYYKNLRDKLSKMTDDEYRDYVSSSFPTYKLLKIRIGKTFIRGVLSAPVNNQIVMAGGSLTYFITLANDGTPSRIFNFADKIKLINENGYSKFTSWDSINFGKFDFIPINESAII